MADLKSLPVKLVRVMEAVDYIPKRGRNVSQGYAYAMDADIADAVRKAMAEQGVVMLPRVVEHGVRQIQARDRELNINTVLMEFTFIDAETGENFTVSTVGEGMDSGDKGCYKAMTGATKYALLKSFQIPTGDDPESDNGEPPKENRSRTRATQGKRAESSPKPANQQKPANSQGAASQGKPSNQQGKPDFNVFWKTTRELGFDAQAVHNFAKADPAKMSQEELDALVGALREVREKEGAA